MKITFRYILSAVAVSLIAFNLLLAQWVNTGLTNLDVLSLAVSGPNFFAGTTYDGIFLSTNNGTSWTVVNTDLNWFSSLVVSDTNLFAGAFGGVLLSTNNGTTWTAVNNGLINLNVISLAVSGPNLFAGTGYGVFHISGVFLSTNNGTTWVAINNGIQYESVGSLAVSGTNLFAGTVGTDIFSGNGVFLSTNNGASWTAANNGLTDPDVPSLAVSGTNIFAGTYGDGVFISTNNGTSWTTINSGLTNTYIRSLIISGSNLFAGTEGGVYLSTNNGISWTAVNAGLTNLDILSLAVSETYLFVGIDGSGVWRRMLSEIIPVELISFSATSSANEVILKWSTATETNNQGFYIERKSANSQYVEVDFVPGFGTTVETKSYSYIDSKISAGTYTYRLKQIDFDGSYEYSYEVEVEVATLLVFALEQNYPNPFNPNTVISYQLPVSGNFTFLVFDLLGSRVAALIDEYKLAGRYEIEFNASSLPTGVYFYQLKAGDYSATKKMVLMK